MANRFWVGGTGTWDASDTTHWAATSGGAGGQSVPTSSDAVTFDASSGGGTVTVSHASLSVLNLTMGAFTGTLDFATNDNNITIAQYFSGSGTGTRTLNMGDGTWTFTSGLYSCWDMGTTTNLTFAANGSTIHYSNTAPTNHQLFKGGGLTYNTVTFAAVTTGFTLTISGSNTFTTLNVNLPRNINWNGSLGAPVQQTITNAFAWTGGSVSDVSMFHGNVSEGWGVVTIVATNGGTMEWVALAGLTFTTGAVTANSSFNMRSNTGITINAPSTGGMLVHPGMNGRLSA